MSRTKLSRGAAAMLSAVAVAIGAAGCSSTPTTAGTASTAVDPAGEAPSVPDVEESNPESVATACDSVGDFAVNIIAGTATCAEIAPIAQAYADAINADTTGQLGSEMEWSQDGWSCALDYDTTSDVDDEAAGLLCQDGANQFTLNSGDAT